MAGGSTLGNISNTQVPVSTVDIGLPQLAMHSPYETAGVMDTYSLVKAAELFFAVKEYRLILGNNSNKRKTDEEK